MEKMFVPMYCDSRSILLVNRNGHLKKLYCPFRVKVIESVVDFRAGIYVWVEEVGSNGRDELTYLVFGVLYSHRHFEIEVKF